MGLPEKEYEEGDACANCWGDGKTFGDIATPKRIIITGSGFAGACAPCNDSFIAVQAGGSPCLWQFNNGTVLGSWSVGPLNTLFQLEMVGGPVCYNQSGGKCKKVSTFNGKSVSINIAKPATPEFTFAKTLGISPSEKTWHEDYPKAGPTEVLRLANKLDRICVYVEYTPEY